MQLEPSIVVSPLASSERSAWQAFLAGAVNATLFHDLDFLDYHPTGRFAFEHLVFRQKGHILALLPGGLVHRDEGEVFVSPLGASVGGFAVAPGLRSAQALALVQALQEYAQTRGWAGVELTLAPGPFAAQDTDLLSFALFSRGFMLKNRWLCAMLDLESAPAPRFKALFRKRQVSHVNAAERKGMIVVEQGPEGLDAFLEVFHDTYTRHGATATHSPEEIAWLLTRLPDRVRLVLAMLDGRCAAGVLLLQINPRAAYTFYICASTALAEERGNLMLYAKLADLLAERGVRWLDLGPASWDGNYNAGVTFFKESLGCLMRCRDRWSWRVGQSSGAALAGWNFMAEEAS